MIQRRTTTDPLAAITATEQQLPRPRCDDDDAKQPTTAAATEDATAVVAGVGKQRKQPSLSSPLKQRSLSPPRPIALRRCGSFERWSDDNNPSAIANRRRRGVVPYARCDDGSIAVMLGIDAKSGQITDFGGYAAEDVDGSIETPAMTAVRELFEETIGVLRISADAVTAASWCGGYSPSVLIFAVDVTNQVSLGGCTKNVDAVCSWFSSEFMRARSAVVAEMLGKKPSLQQRVLLENSAVIAIPIEVCEQYALSACIGDRAKCYPVSGSAAWALGGISDRLPQLYTRIRGALFMAVSVAAAAVRKK